MRRILITGFEPFAAESMNPSRELALSFQNDFEVRILPVSYERAIHVLNPDLAAGRFDLVLMLGQAGGRRFVELERVALNLEDNASPDEDGDLRLDRAISSSGPEAFLSRLPLRQFATNLQARQLPVQVSLSAGAFVCNSLYYKVLSRIQQSSLRIEALFVHLPFTPEQVQGKPAGTPSLEISEMKKCVESLILEIQKALQ